MRTSFIIFILGAWGTVAYAQDTAYVSRDKTTALFFNSTVKMISRSTPDLDVDQKENTLITIKAFTTVFSPACIDVQEVSTAKIYHIPVEFSCGRAGRRIEVNGAPMPVRAIKTAGFNYSAVINKLAEGKRRDVIDHEKTGGVKAWVDKLSLAGNRIFFRLDVRNKSNLPYEIDFVRFYIRDLKTVARMATHEQEIVPLITTLHKKTSIAHKREIAKIFGFHRFSLSEDQALNVELYERNGNRHIYLQITQKDLEDLKTIAPAKQQPGNASVAANKL
ncbi:DUF4138 domain-containing protein [Mucilaginibacter jinjuensis]|uniref:DUF4138 domain-containing protein n=1 Tax=Mucilaginibacter jinjuensis TaxID=1176721 RepID=A0ABY7TCY4_9SPHI|nr:DUF4138 domain-containing protein [Mucilaginibacter jinjuensis]WCT14384.1 DUF4138 domain-containing protein [Mucilaginibacter jinjuensis]